MDMSRGHDLCGSRSRHVSCASRCCCRCSAAAAGNDDELARLLRGVNDPNLADYDGRTALVPPTTCAHACPSSQAPALFLTRARSTSLRPRATGRRRGCCWLPPPTSTSPTDSAVRHRHMSQKL